MRDTGFPSSLIPALAVLAAFAAVRGAAQEAPAAAEPEAEQAPQYRVEFILFEHSDVDPAEEVFIAESPVRLADLPASVLSTPGVPLQQRADGELVNAEPSAGAELQAQDDAAAGPLEDDAPPAGPATLDFIDPFGSLSRGGDSPSAPPFRFRLLGDEDLELQDEYARLDRLDAYRVIAHGGWIQEGLDEAASRPMNLANFGIVNPRGTLRLTRTRFLHLDVDLQYQPAQALAGPGPISGFGALSELSLGPRVRLVEQRRARSGELHYVDHPLLGLLFVITPAPEEDEDAPANAAASPAA